MAESHLFVLHLGIEPQRLNVILIIVVVVVLIAGSLRFDIGSHVDRNLR